MLKAIWRRLLKKQNWIDGVLSGQGGLVKRIDEHRELIKLLEEKRPELFNECPWIKGWLRSQDVFLNALLALSKKQQARIRPPFPRECPSIITDASWPRQLTSYIEVIKDKNMIETHRNLLVQ